MLKILIAFNNWISIPERIAQRRWGLRGRHVVSLICYALLPLTLVALPWKATAILALLLGAVTILGVLGGYIIYIFGYIGKSNIKGLIEYVAKRGKGDALLEVIDAVVTTVANFGVLYTALERLEPGAHFQIVHPTVLVFDLFYFSVVTFATVGFGDIVPISLLAKLLCLGELTLAFLILFIGLGLVIGAREP